MQYFFWCHFHFVWGAAIVPLPYLTSFVNLKYFIKKCDSLKSPLVDEIVLEVALVMLVSVFKDSLTVVPIKNGIMALHMIFMISH